MKAFVRGLMALVVALSAVAVGVLVSCGGNDDDDGGSASFSLFMIDAPVDEADEINITVNAVSVNGPDGWVDLAVEPARYNLLELMNNAGVTLAEQDLPEGDYGEIRLVIGCDGEDAPDIVIEGQSYELKVPSGCTSGFKLKGEFSVVAGEELVLIMDFDMQKSVHETGEGKYMLNPVVRFIQADAAGNIEGSIDPVVPRSVIYAFEADAFTGDNFEDAVNSTVVREDGSFVLAALPPGTYDIVVAAPGYDTAVYLEDVVVEAGQDTVLEEPIDLGTSA